MTHFELLKYAATGIASPGMTAYDKMRALAMAGGGAVKTLTGVPPLSFKSNGKPLISWSMLGNGQQIGTPSPSSPIYPSETGDRTGNLFDKSSADIYENSTIAPLNQWNYSPDFTGRILRIKCKSSTQYTISFNQTFDNATIYRISTTGSDSVPISGETGTIPCTSVYSGDKPITKTITIGDSAKYILLQINGQMMDSMCNALMINEGAIPLPYEPYGYKIPITNAGQTQTVYLGQVQTTRRVKKLVLDGTEDWSNQTVHTTTSVSIVKPANGVLQPKTVLILSSDFIATDEASQSNPFVVGKMYVGSYYISFNYDGANNLDTWKSHLAERYASGNPICIWYVLAEPITAIVNEPLCKIGDYADTLDSADAGITIPTAKGANTLTVDTDLKPSSMTITYRE